MPYGFIQDVPADENMYRQIRARIGDETPRGLVSHLVIKHEGGLRHIDVWETRADWERFREERADPAVGAVLASLGIPNDPSQVAFEVVEVVDAWIGDVVESAR